METPLLRPVGALYNNGHPQFLQLGCSLLPHGPIYVLSKLRKLTGGSCALTGICDDSRSAECDRTQGSMTWGQCVAGLATHDHITQPPVPVTSLASRFALNSHVHPKAGEPGRPQKIRASHLETLRASWESFFGCRQMQLVCFRDP